MLQGITDQKFRFRVTVIFTMALVLLIANVAYAAWTATGSGTGEAAAGEAVELDIDPVSAGTLYPTVTVNVTVEVTNPNPYNVSVTSIDLDAAEGTDGFAVDNDGSEMGGCNLAAISWEGAHTYALDAFVVGKDNGTQQITLEDAVTLENDANDDCQGADFTVYLELSGESTAAAPTTP